MDDYVQSCGADLIVLATRALSTRVLETSAVLGSVTLAERKAEQGMAAAYMYMLTWETPVSRICRVARLKRLANSPSGYSAKSPRKLIQ